MIPWKLALGAPDGMGWAVCPKFSCRCFRPAFRLFTTQLIVNGTATQGEIARAFGVSITTVKRGVKRYRAAGAAAFFMPPKLRQGRKLTPELLARVQALLDENLAVPAISVATGVLANTLHKALRAGRLVRRAGLEKKVPRPTQR